MQDPTPPTEKQLADWGRAYKELGERGEELGASLAKLGFQRRDQDAAAEEAERQAAEEAERQAAEESRRLVEAAEGRGA